MHASQPVVSGDQWVSEFDGISDEACQTRADSRVDVTYVERGQRGHRGDVMAYVPSAQQDRFWFSRSRTASGRVTAILWTAGPRS
eukprot:5706714-Prymnesium_polylepis.2